MINQAIQEAKKMIEENSYYVPEDNARVVDVTYIEEFIERLKALPQEQSLEELLEKMPE